MTEDDLARATITQVGRLIRRRVVSPVDLVTACLRRIKRVDDRLNCFITVAGEQALEQARIAENELMSTGYRGPLHGIPFSAKDVYMTNGIRTTAGSAILRDFVPTRDARAVELMRDAGAVLIGKTNLHEFHAGATNENTHYGPCRNPWDPERISGGSSGGSGAAVAASLGLTSLGTDTGGSIRIPAALCGVVGYKPTFGLVSRDGIIPESWSCDHCGPLAKTVRDCALVASKIIGHDPNDSGSSRERAGSLLRRLTGGVDGLRLGLPRDAAFGTIDGEVADAVEAAARLLEDLGATVEDVNIPDPVEISDVLQVIIWSEAANYHQNWLRERGEEYGAEIREKFEGAMLHLATEYIQAQRVQETIRRRLQAVFEEIDLLLMPTVPVPAPSVGGGILIDGQPEEVERTIAKLTPLANLTGGPALSVPCGFTRSGLPIGLAIQGPPFQDKLVFRAAFAYEQATEWHTASPPV